MGLTHHWERPTEFPAEAFAKASADAKIVMKKSGVLLAGFEGGGEPVFTSDAIMFNGKAPCEPFEIHAVEFDDRGRERFFGHCKTEHRPYDLVVKAVLIVLRHHLGDAITVTSDEGVEEWELARQLCQQALGYGEDFLLG